MLLTGIFYTFFYVLPLILIPTFLVDSNKDFLIYSSMFVVPDNHEIKRYQPQIPSGLGVVNEECGIGRRILAWGYNRFI